MMHKNSNNDNDNDNKNNNNNNNKKRKQQPKWAKGSGTIVKLSGTPSTLSKRRQRSSAAPFYCRIINNEYVAPTLAEIMANNKPKSTPWLTRDADQTLEDRQRMLVNYRDANRTCILIIKLMPLGVLPVLTAPEKSYDNNDKRFFVPWTEAAGCPVIGKRYVAHDFQRFVAAGARHSTQMANLVAMTRSMLPRWRPQANRGSDASTSATPVLPPPVQFADQQAVHNPWLWRLNRNDTITLCNFPLQQDQPTLHKYAGHLPRRHPPSDR